MRDSKLGIIAMLLGFLLLFPSCVITEREFVKPSLPEFTIGRPVRPNLLRIEDGTQLPVPVLTNTILLQGYARELEAYAEGWEEFYTELREEYATDNRDKENNGQGEVLSLPEGGKGRTELL